MYLELPASCRGADEADSQWAIYVAAISMHSSHDHQPPAHQMLVKIRYSGSGLNSGRCDDDGVGFWWGGREVI